MIELDKFLLAHVFYDAWAGLGKDGLAGFANPGRPEHRKDFVSEQLDANWGARTLFHGNRSTKPGMASRELVYEVKCVELAGLSNQIITSICLGSWRPRQMESASPEKRKKLFTVSRQGSPN